MRLACGYDHRGKRLVDQLLQCKGFTLHRSLFLHEAEDYPDCIPFVVHHVKKEGAIGFLTCGTGIGMSIAANRFRGIRAALCHEPDEARLSRAHNDANILVLSSSIELRKALACLEFFFSTPFEAGRHQRRIDKIEGLNEDRIKNF